MGKNSSVTTAGTRPVSGHTLADLMKTVIFLIAIALAASARATTYTAMSDANLLDQSEVVVNGRVTTVRQPSDAVRPETWYTIDVMAVLKGDIHQTEITVAIPGGRGTDGRYLTVAGAPRFSADTEVLLFLNPRTDGRFTVAQFMLGAFTVSRRNGVDLLQRDLSEARELPGNTRESKKSRESGPAKMRRERTRALFMEWIRNRIAGNPASDAYWQYFTDEQVPHIFRYQTQGARWRRFDAGAAAAWTAHQNGQQNMTGGGYAEFQAALTAWDDDAGSNVDYTYAGTTAVSHGLTQSDGENSILFNDPNNEISGSYNCSSGGTLALGGWWSQGRHSYNGTSYNTIIEGDIVVQNGAGCYFEGNNGKNGAEVFAHELGHTLGLGHSSDTDALMYAQAHGDGRGAQLQQDDRNGIRHLYAAAIPPEKPGAPMVTHNITDAEMTISWQAVATADSYRLHRSIDAGQTGMEIYSGSDLRHIDNLIVRGTTYFYRVQACNAYGCGDFSDSASGRIPAIGTRIHVLTPVYQLLLFQ